MAFTNGLLFVNAQFKADLGGVGWVWRRYCRFVHVSNYAAAQKIVKFPYLRMSLCPKKISRGFGSRDPIHFCRTISANNFTGFGIVVGRIAVHLVRWSACIDQLLRLNWRELVFQFRF